MSRVSGNFHVQLATHLPDWSAGGLLRCSAVRLSVCRGVLQIPRARHARLVADKSLASSYSILVRHVRHVRHARFLRDMLATYAPGCHEYATWMLRGNCSSGIQLHGGGAEDCVGINWQTLLHKAPFSVEISISNVKQNSVREFSRNKNIQRERGHKIEHVLCCEIEFRK